MTNTLKKFQTTDISEIKSLSLLNRVDTKYLANEENIHNFLNIIQEDFSIVSKNQNRTIPYRSTYFDTPDFFFYNEHQRGRIHRQKVRIREYQDTKDLFLEVKTKKSPSYTIKQRIKIDENKLNQDYLNTILTKVRAKDLQPCLDIFYDRATFINKKNKMRITLDSNLRFKSEEVLYSSSIYILEVKEPKDIGARGINSTIRKAKIKPGGVSKYCLGVALCYPELKNNLMHEKKRKILTLSKEGIL